MAWDQKYLDAVVLCAGAMGIDGNLKLMREVLGRPLTAVEAAGLLGFIAGRLPEIPPDAVRAAQAALLGQPPARRKRGRPKGSKGPDKSSKLLRPYVLLWRNGMRQIELYREWIPADRTSPIERREYFRNTMRRTFQRWDKDPDMQQRAKEALGIRQKKFTPPKLLKRLNRPAPPTTVN